MFCVRQRPTLRQRSATAAADPHDNHRRQDSSHAQISVAHIDHVATAQLPAATYLRFPVDPYPTVCEDRLDVRAKLNQVSKLEELTQPNHLGRDHNFAHVAIISRGPCGCRAHSLVDRPCRGGDRFEPAISSSSSSALSTSWADAASSSVASCDRLTKWTSRLVTPSSSPGWSSGWR